MNYGIAFTPLVPSIVLWIAIAAIAVIAGLLLLARSRGAAVRVAALALIVLALSNPSFTREDREPLSSVACVVFDKSPSQEFGNRMRETEQARDEVGQLIGQTVAEWDPYATSRKIELQIGKDLQFIRINGTLVGGLVGLVIYSLTRLL